MERFRNYEHRNSAPAAAAEREGADAFLEAAYQKALSITEADPIDMSQFEPLYGKAKVSEDMAKVENYEKKFQEEQTDKKRRDKKMATVVEALIYDQAKRGWMGAEARVSRSSKFDDYVNGIDCITGYPQREQAAALLAMAIDATWSSHPGSKFDRIGEDLSRGKLGKIRYFKENGVPQKEREVPRVVVGASEKTLHEVIQLWMDGNEEAFEHHPVQILFLEEIVEQLEGFRQFSQKRNHARQVAAFDRYLGILKPILEEKRRAIPSEARIANDIVSNGIKASLVGLNFERPAQ